MIRTAKIFDLGNGDFLVLDQIVRVQVGRPSSVVQSYDDYAYRVVATTTSGASVTVKRFPIDPTSPDVEQIHHPGHTTFYEAPTSAPRWGRDERRPGMLGGDPSPGIGQAVAGHRRHRPAAPSGTPTPTRAIGSSGPARPMSARTTTYRERLTFALEHVGVAA